MGEGAASRTSLCERAAPFWLLVQLSADVRALGIGGGSAPLRATSGMTQV